MIALREWCWHRATMADEMEGNAKFSKRARRRYGRWCSFWHFAGNVCNSGLVDAILHSLHVRYELRQERRQEREREATA